MTEEKSTKRAKTNDRSLAPSECVVLSLDKIAVACVDMSGFDRIESVCGATKMAIIPLNDDGSLSKTGNGKKGRRLFCLNGSSGKVLRVVEARSIKAVRKGQEALGVLGYIPEDFIYELQLVEADRIIPSGLTAENLVSLTRKLKEAKEKEEAMSAALTAARIVVNDANAALREAKKQFISSLMKEE